MLVGALEAPHPGPLVVVAGLEIGLNLHLKTSFNELSKRGSHVDRQSPLWYVYRPRSVSVIQASACLEI